MSEPDKSNSEKSNEELAEDRTEKAEDRTRFAEDRTIMANERTFAGWLRTGLASVGIGLGFQAIFGKIDPVWMPKLVATGFILIGIVIFVGAYRRAQSLFERLDAHEVDKIPKRNNRIITAILVIGSILVAIGIWYFDWTN